MMKSNKIVVPPIKSQGIKTKLIPWIKEMVPTESARWIEPFLGTGVVAFNLKFTNAVLNDSNPHIINFYRGIQRGTITPTRINQYLQEEGDTLSKAGDNGYDHYKKIRERFNQDFSPLDFIFLSRAGFNGMMRFNRKGKWNIPFCKKPNRFAQSYVTKITNQVANVSRIIRPEPEWTFYHGGFERIIEMAHEGDIIYCDPPYLGRHVDYFNSWNEQDEENLYGLLSNTKAKFILSTWHHTSWRKNEMIEKYWNKFNIVTKDHFYHNGANLENRNTVVEALICNFELKDIASHNHEVQSVRKQDQLSLQLISQSA